MSIDTKQQSDPPSGNTSPDWPYGEPPGWWVTPEDYDIYYNHP